MTTTRPIIVTRRDHDRLTRLLETHASRRDAAAAAALEEELTRARIVEPAEVPSDVVTMHSAVRFCDEAAGTTHEVQLVYPHGADAARGRVSILAPVGSALLGLAAGEAIDWRFPDGRTRRLRVDAVTYQPEAAGDGEG